jgi:hypothetical protein
MTQPPTTAQILPVVLSGSFGDIRMTADMLAAYVQAIEGNDEISLKRKARLRRYFGEFVNNQNYHARMSNQQFKKEGNFSNGIGGTVAIWEFKAFQWRLYGGIAQVSGRRCFVGVAVDPSKKQDRANQELLAIAGKRLGRFVEFGARK